MSNKIKTIGIYKITSPSGKIYIGQSANMEERFRHYKNLHCKGQRHIYASIIKYGWDNHKFEILEECSIGELNNLEIKYIAKYDSTNREIGMNLQSGGSAPTDSPESNLLKKMNHPKRIEFYAERNGVVQKFNSMTEAEKILGVTRNSIRQSLKNPGQKFGKYSYSYEYPTEITNNEYKLKGLKRPDKIKELMSNNSTSKKSIIAKINDLTFTFDSIKEASIQLGDSKKVIGFALKNPTKSKSKYKYFLNK